MKKQFYCISAALILCSHLGFSQEESSEPSKEVTQSKSASPGDRIDYTDPTGICVYDDRGHFIGYTEGHQ